MTKVIFSTNHCIVKRGKWHNNTVFVTRSNRVYVICSSVFFYETQDLYDRGNSRLMLCFHFSVSTVYTSQLRDVICFNSWPTVSRSGISPLCLTFLVIVWHQRRTRPDFTPFSGLQFYAWSCETFPQFYILCKEYLQWHIAWARTYFIW